jgi:DNA polymerase
MPVLYRDYETRSALDLTKVGAWRYATHETTDVWCCAYAVDDGPVKLWLSGDSVPEEFLTAANNPEWLVSAFNDSFERLIEQHIIAPRYGWPLVPIERHRCSQAAALAHALPGKLESVAKALSLPHQKDTAGAKLMLKMARPRKPHPGEDPSQLYWHDWDPRLGEYCKQDVETERAIRRCVGHLSAEEQALWELDAKINDRGVHLDDALLAAASKITEQARAEIAAELSNLTGGEVTSINQCDCLVSWLAARGCTISDVKKDTVRRALTGSELPPEVRRALELRRDGAHVDKFDTMRAWRSTDGRVHGALKYHGASTGRWTSYGIQLQNLKRPAGEDMSAAIAAVSTGDLAHVRQHYEQPLSIVSDLARAMICAVPNHRFIAADFSGIESRVTAWLSGQKSKLDQWAGFDLSGAPEDEPYLLNGRRCKVPEEQARAIGKTCDLAFGYMGSVGAWRRLAPDDKSTDEQIIGYRNAWRRTHLKTVNFWHDLDRAAVGAVQNKGENIPCGRVSFQCEGDFLFMTLPSGRRLAYPFPRIETNDRDKPIVVFKDHQHGNWADCRHGAGAYGGTWIENAVQAVSRDLFAAAMPRLEAAGYPIVLHVHDEIVAEVPDGFGTEAEFKTILLRVPPWAEGLPLNAKTRNGPRFCKMNGATPAPPVQPTVGIFGATEVPWEAEERTSGRPAGSRFEYNPSDDDDDDATRNYASGEQSWGKASGEFIYLTAGGLPYLRVVRMEHNGKKSFPQYHQENGRWVKGKPKGPKIPYHLPTLLAAAPDAPIWICEGEKDADNVAALGLIATTNSEGAGNWVDGLNSYFVGKKTVYLVEDNDAAGRAHVARVASALAGIVPDIRAVSFPDVPVGEDVSWWLQHGGNKELLLERSKNAPFASAQSDGLKILRAADLEMCGLDWFWPERFARGKIGIIAGMPDMGKGQLAAYLAAVASNTVPFPCEEGTCSRRGNVLWLNAEDDNRDTIIPRPGRRRCRPQPRVLHQRRAGCWERQAFQPGHRSRLAAGRD